MNLIAIDIGSTIGLAVEIEGELSFIEHVVDTGNWGKGMWDWTCFLDSILTSDRFDLLILERSFPRKHPLKELYCGLHLGALMVATANCVEKREIHVSTARSLVFGKTCKHKEVLPKVTEMGYSVPSKHCADALVVLLGFQLSKKRKAA